VTRFHVPPRLTFFVTLWCVRKLLIAVARVVVRFLPFPAPHCERAARETEKAEALARAVAELKVQIEAKRRFLRS